MTFFGRIRNRIRTFLVGSESDHVVRVRFQIRLKNVIKNLKVLNNQIKNLQI